LGQQAVEPFLKTERLSASERAMLMGGHRQGVWLVAEKSLATYPASGRCGDQQTDGRPTVSDPRTGGCLCGAIRYETVGEPVFSLRCHCRDSQRQSGAANVPAARVPSAGFRILQGTPKRYVTKADSGNDIARVFCGDCGTPL
jgi:hypothetical protein